MYFGIVKYTSNLLVVFILFIGCGPLTESSHKKENTGIELIILGNVQDAGSPQIGCQRDCCEDLLAHPDPTRMVSSIGLIDHSESKTYLFDASPDMPRQLALLKKAAGLEDELPEAIFLTHAHIGHYTGLMFLGREAIGSKGVKVFAMPRMEEFLKSNGPWNQLVSIGNIAIQSMPQTGKITLSKQLTIDFFIVPHRDEYSETIGFIINGNKERALFIPDIDKWERWNWSIDSLVQEVDYAFLDGTFYDGDELNRDMSEIPHPFIVESVEYLKVLGDEDRSKVHFIHFNHTNPVLNSASDETQGLLNDGFKVARFNQRFFL